MTERASEPPPPRAAATLLVIARVLVPIALAIVGYAVLVAQRWSVDHELQIVAPDAARPGDPIPVRAFVFAGIDAAGEDPGELADVPVEVELVCGDRSAGRATLSPAALHSADGSLGPAPGPGLCELRARAFSAGETLATVRRPIAIVADAPPAPTLGRIGSELQLLRLAAPILDDPRAVAPALQVRVASGTCVPEHPCALLVHAPDVDAVALEATSATVSGVERNGALHVVTLIVHGPEVAATLVVSRAGAPIAHAELQVPVALATPWVDGPRAGAGLALELAPPPGREALIVDRYVEGRWVETRTVAPGELRLEGLSPGLHRVQVRADPFGGGAVIARYVLVGEPLERAGDRLAAEGIAMLDAPSSPPELLLASAEEEIRELPAASSGLEADRAELAARRRRIQVVGAIALGLGIVVLLVSLLRHGLRAAEEARDVMIEAGDETASSRATRVRMTASVLLFVGAVAVAMLSGVALILARAALVAP